MTDMHDGTVRLPGALVVVDDHAIEAFDQHLPDSSRLAFRVAYGVLRHRETAEDVAQEALVRAFRALPRLRDHTKLRAWLVRLTWRLALDEQRGAKRRLIRDTGAADLEPRQTTPESSLRVAQLWDAIDRLPEPLRLTLVLGGIEGYAVAEVASMLGIAEGTVKSRLFEARRRVKELLS